MAGRRLGTLRGQLVLWYLSVLALVLLGLGIFQYVTLSQYLRTTTASGIRLAAFAEMRNLGPCLTNTSGALNRNAQILAQLLGSRDTGVKIVTPSGETLADHSFDIHGSLQPLNLSAVTIRRLIALTPGTDTPLRVVPHASQCHRLPARVLPRYVDLLSAVDSSSLREGDLTLVAIPLGPYGHPVGFALFGRSSASADATIRRTGIVFALGALVALILAVVVALPLINRALGPLRRIAATAGAIARGDLERRANLTQASDEIGRLGSAFDTMVDRLQAALLAANESEDRMRRFLADASHELRTPLTVLRGMSEILLRQGSREGPELESALRAIHDESVRLSKLVDDLLTLSRMDAGQPLNPESLEIRPFLEQFVERYASAWPDRHIGLALEAVDGASAYVDADALRRILTNLVDNAARYSTTGRPITLGGSAQADGITVSVSDEGPGLAQEDAKRVFERFFRGARSRSRPAGGSGLGLAIVDAIVKQSGGRVSMETGPDRGTTVLVHLPQDSVN